MQKQGITNRRPVILALLALTILSVCCLCVGVPLVDGMLSDPNAAAAATSTIKPPDDPLADVTSIVAVQTQAPTPEPTSTPGPTETPVVAPLYATIEAEYRTMTDVQQERYLDSIEGLDVVRWEGVVKDVVELIGFYSVYVAVGEDTFGANVYLLGISEEDALSLNLEETITFSGRILSIEEFVSPLLSVTSVTIHETEDGD